MGYTSNNDNEVTGSGDEPINSPRHDDNSASMPCLLKRAYSPSAPERLAKRRQQRLQLFPAKIHSSEDESDDNMDSQISDYLDDDKSDGTSSSKISHSDGNIRHGLNSFTNRASSIRSKYCTGPSPVNLTDFSSWPVVGFLEWTKSGSVVLTLGLFMSPSGPTCETEPIWFRIGDFSVQFGARLERLAAGIPSTTTKCKAAPARSKVRFTPQEDAILINLRERKGLLWEEIERSFPHRTKASLQVHYSMKLKNRAT